MHDIFHRLAFLYVVKLLWMAFGDFVVQRNEDIQVLNPTLIIDCLGQEFWENWMFVRLGMRMGNSFNLQ